MASKYFSTPWTNHNTPHWLRTSSNCPIPSFQIQQCNDFQATCLEGGLSQITTYHLYACFSSHPSPITAYSVLLRNSTVLFLRPLLTHQHVVVGIVRDGEKVRRNFVAFLPLVYLGHFSAIDGQPFVRVDRHAEEARIGLEVGENIKRGLKGVIIINGHKHGSS